MDQHRDMGVHQHAGRHSAGRTIGAGVDGAAEYDEPTWLRFRGVRERGRDAAALDVHVDGGDLAESGPAARTLTGGNIDAS